MAKSQEEKNIENGDEVVKELHKVYTDGIAIVEYSKLLKAYKTLYRRYEKTIKLSDVMGNGIMKKNDNLQDNLKYTVQTARTKLMDNVVEHRKTKETSSRYLLKNKMLEESYNTLFEQNSVNEKKLKYYVKTYGDIAHNMYTQVGEKENTKFDINPPFYRNKTIKHALLLESPHDKTQFILSKIGVQSFDNIVDKIMQLTSLNSFMVAISKYISNYLDKNDFLFHHKMDEFYIISNKKEIDTIKELIDKLNTKREVMNFDVHFCAGITQFIENEDSEEILLQRCDYAYSKVKKENTTVVVM